MLTVTMTFEELFASTLNKIAVSARYAFLCHVQHAGLNAQFRLMLINETKSKEQNRRQ